MASRVTYQNMSPGVTRKLWCVMSPDAAGRWWHNAPGLSCHLGADILVLDLEPNLIRMQIKYTRGWRVMTWLYSAGDIIHLFTVCECNNSFIQAEGGTIYRGLARCVGYVEGWMKELFHSKPVNKYFIILTFILWISNYYNHTEFYWGCGMLNSCVTDAFLRWIYMYLQPIKLQENKKNGAKEIVK